MRPYVEPVSPITLTAVGGKGEVFTKLMRIPGVQLIYASALACTRHRNVDFITMQRKGRLSFLLFDEVDMITGDYIDKTKQATAEIAEERAPSGIILLTGCQSALLSTDYKLLSEEIEQEIGVPVRVHDGCRLCGTDHDDMSSDAIDFLLYDFIRPAEKSAELSVNILGTASLEPGSELLNILERAGVKKINCLANCKTWEDYQDMGRAHLNIVTGTQELAVGPHLEQKLGIPWVRLGGIYDAQELADAYQTLSAILGVAIDLTAQQAELESALQATRQAVGEREIIVDDDGDLAKFLVQQGFSVTQLKINPHKSISKELRAWFEENAPQVQVKSFTKGGPGGGKPGGPHGGGRPDGRGGPGGGRPSGKPAGGKPQSLAIGYAGSLAALEKLKRNAGGNEA